MLVSSSFTEGDSYCKLKSSQFECNRHTLKIYTPWCAYLAIASLSDFDADAGEGLAGEVGLLGFDEGDYAVLGCVNGKIAGHVGAWASNLSGASLTDENFAVLDFLTTEALDAEALASIVMYILGGTASFDM